MHFLKIRPHTSKSGHSKKKAICQPLCQMQWNSGTTDIKTEKRKHQRHICGEPQCWVWTSLSQWYDLFHLHSHYLKDDAVHWHLPAHRITRKRQSSAATVCGIRVGRHCRLPTLEHGNIRNYSLYTTSQVNMLVSILVTIPPLPLQPARMPSAQCIPLKEAVYAGRCIKQTVAAECSQEQGHRIH